MTAPTSYVQCPSCNKVIPTPPKPASGEAGPCSNCNASGEIRRAWPYFLGPRWLDLVRGQPADDSPEDLFVAAALRCETADLLMKRLLADILRRQEVGAQHEQIIMRSNPGRTNKFPLFEMLTEETFDEAATKVGYPEFPGQWRRVAELRQQFVSGHFNAILGDRDSRCNDLDAVLDDMLEVFRLLHNQYAA